MSPNHFSRRFLGMAMAVVLSSCLATSALAQSGYRIGEGNGDPDQGASQSQSQQGDDTATSNPSNPETSGPVRMARFSFMNGNVTWRPDPDTEWAPASLNMPLREGAEIWVGDGGRAELQFDDGSVVRFGSGAVATLQTMYSDSKGEFTEIKLTDGLASMDLRTDHSIYQIDTPKGAIKSTGPSRVRVGVDDDVEIGVREGTASLDGVAGKTTLKENDYMDIAPDADKYEIQALPDEDSWDKFTDERHAVLSHDDPNLPDNMKIVGGDLDQYGGWRDDSEYGHVWAPRESAGWSPYHDGKWVWCEPFGWTWVGNEAWGWTPYHYGSWIHRGWGWGWVPGPAAQYWSPGVVDFSETDGEIGWTPLAPFECHYPSGFGLGIWGGGWSTWFSIGFCGSWFAGDGFCYARPWNNRWVNRWHGFGGRGGDPFSRNVGGLVAHHGSFHPANAVFGTVTAHRDGFGRDAAYSRVTGHDGQAVFERGQSFGAPRRGTGFVSGPSNVRPNQSSWSSSHSFTSHTNSGILSRPVYRGNAGTYDRGDAARSARESLGWSRGNPQTGPGSRGGSNNGFSPFSTGPSGSRGGNAPVTRSSASTRGGWSVPDHRGWSHVHTDSHSSGGSRSSGGGNKSGNGGRGH